MKVIKKGRVRKAEKQQKLEGWSREFVCTGAGNRSSGCHAILRVFQADIFKTYFYGFDAYTFICPLCSTKTNVDVPEGLEVSDTHH